MLCGMAFALLIATPFASASEPVDSRAELGAVLPIARDAWPASPCAGRETVEFVDDIGTSEGAEPALGAALADRCAIALHPMLLEPGREYLLCVIVTHEFGHLAGYNAGDLDGGSHTSARLDVMYPYADWYVPCEAVRGGPPPLVPPPSTDGTQTTIEPTPPSVVSSRTRCSLKTTTKARRKCRIRRRTPGATPPQSYERRSPSSSERTPRASASAPS